MSLGPTYQEIRLGEILRKHLGDDYSEKYSDLREDLLKLLEQVMW